MIKNIFIYSLFLVATAWAPITFAKDAVPAPTAHSCVSLFRLPQVDDVARERERFIEVEYPEYRETLEQDYRTALSLADRFRYTLGEGQPVLTVVIPAYKEQLRITSSIERMKAFFQAFPYPVEVMIRIEKSPDATVEVALAAVDGDPLFQVFDHPVQRGKGYAVKQGMLEAHGKYVLFMDADLSTPLPEIFHFLAVAFEKPEAGVLIGDRHHKESEITVDQSWRRQMTGRVFRSLAKTVIGTFGLKNICDTQCGFKLFRRDSAQRVFSNLDTDGFAFDVEALLLAHRLQYEILALPIRWEDDINSTVNPLVDAPKMLRDIGRAYLRVRNIDLK